MEDLQYFYIIKGIAISKEYPKNNVKFQATVDQTHSLIAIAHRLKWLICNPHLESVQMKNKQ